MAACSLLLPIEKKRKDILWNVKWMVNRLRDKISRKKSRNFVLQTAKKYEIDSRNLGFSKVFPDEKSRDLKVSQEMYLYNSQWMVVVFFLPPFTSNNYQVLCISKLDGVMFVSNGFKCHLVTAFYGCCRCHD
jgi:hypothetical protein